MNEFLLKAWACTVLGKFSNTKLCFNLKNLKTAEASEYLNSLWRAVPGDLAKLAENELIAADSMGIKIVSIFDSEYPRPLLEISDPPPILFVKGELPKIDCIGIVGSRRCSAYGKKFAKLFSSLITKRYLSVISGLASGVDSFAHQGAIEASEDQHPGVGVLGCGFNFVYPAHNRALYQKLLEGGGALVSEFGLYAEPRNYLFPRRNRIISGLSKAVIVIEASERSGSLITARTANEQGRDVLALPGPIDSQASSGCNKLISQGARIICSEQDLIDYLDEQGLGIATKTISSYDSDLLLKIRSADYTVETLSNALKIPIKQLYPALLELELRGELSISITGAIQTTH